MAKIIYVLSAVEVDKKNYLKKIKYIAAAEDYELIKNKYENLIRSKWRIAYFIDKVNFYETRELERN